MSALMQYIKTMVEPTVDEFMREPLSPRRAYIACVVVYHAIDRVTYGKTKEEEQAVKAEWRKLSREFALVEIMALDMKHVKSNRHGDPNKPTVGLPIGLALLGTMGFNTHTPNDIGQSGSLRNITFLVRDAVKFLHQQAEKMSPA